MPAGGPAAGAHAAMPAPHPPSPLGNAGHWAGDILRYDFDITKRFDLLRRRRVDGRGRRRRLDGLARAPLALNLFHIFLIFVIRSDRYDLAEL